MEINNKESIKPNFFIVGAAKSGTTSLYYYLKQHPEIFMSPIKEPNYFSSDIDPKKFKKKYKTVMDTDLTGYFNQPCLREMHIAFVKNWEDYTKLFRAVRGEKAVGEISNSYLYSKEAAKNIKSAVPKAKIIMILRNPIERAYSHYLMDLKIGYCDSSFLEELDKDNLLEEKGWGISNLYIELGQYFQQVKRYLEIFSEQDVKIYLFEDFKKDTLWLLKDLFEFLNVDAGFSPDLGKKYAQAYIPKSKYLNRILQNTGIKNLISKIVPLEIKDNLKFLYYTKNNMPALTSEEKEYLLKIFKNEISMLSKLIKKDLNHWINKYEV